MFFTVKEKMFSSFLICSTLYEKHTKGVMNGIPDLPMLNSYLFIETLLEIW